MDKTLEYMIKLSEKVKQIKEEHKQDNAKLTKELDRVIKSIPVEIKKTIDELKPKDNEQDDMLKFYKLLDKVKMYTIKNGNWYFEGKDTGIKATGVDGKDGKDGRDGKDGINGKDGTNGKNGINGINGKDGKDGRDGRDGKDGVDGNTPVFDIVEVETVNSADDADVEVTRENDTYKMKLKIPRGKGGFNGSNGKDATLTTQTITYEEWLALPDKDPNTIYHESLVI